MFKHLRTLIALVFALLAASTLYAQVLPPDPGVCINGPLPPFQSGTTPSNPGRWSNPDRPGLSWDFTFNPDTANNNNGGTLTALWYGFTQAGDPVWYISHSVQYSNLSSNWQAPLYRAIQTAGGTSGIGETVGSMAVSFVPGQPEHMAVSWQLNSMTTPVTECMQRLGSDGNPSRTVVQEVGPPYSGLWFAPANYGWGYQALIDARPAATGSVPEFRESNIVSLYDTAGQPVWLATDSVGSNGQWSSAPPPLALTEMALKYVRATYDVTAAQVSCVSNCTIEVPINSGGVAKFWRSYSDPATGTVGVQVIGNYVNGANTRAINFSRPPNVAPTVMYASQKLTQPNNIIASPTNCLPSDTQAGYCFVAVSWAVRLNSPYPTYDALPFVRDLDSPFSVLPVATTSSGSRNYPLTIGKRVKFVLRTASGFEIAQSSEIRALSPKLDDPAYAFAGLVDYVPAVQSTYAGTGGGSGGTSGGQASYSIPIQMAPGRHGMQPSVSLSYSSRAGNGVAGMGWSLSAPSSLHRCPKTRDQDGVSSVVKFDGDDRLCLDGQRLIKVNGANYGTIDSEYRTEQDGQAKVLQLGGDLISAATYFVVYRADGMRDYYGAVAAANGTSTPDASAQQLLSGNAIPLAWMLRESLDRSNNTVRYSYSSTADNYGSGELLLKKISYTGIVGTPGNRTVEFSYATRPDISSSGLGGSLSRQTQVLTNIETKTPDTSVPPVNVLVRSYQLQYGANPAVIGVSKASGRAQLTQIKECAGDGKCFAPTSLSWLDTPSVGPNLSMQAIQWQGMPQPLQPAGQQPRLVDSYRPIGDLDGDGVLELQRVVFDGVARHFVVSLNADRSQKGVFEGAVLDAQDVNNDGLAELWRVIDLSATGAKLEFKFWDASLQNPNWADNFRTAPPTSALCALQLTAPGSTATQEQLRDVNADGFADLVVFSPGACGGLGRGIYVHLNQSQPVNNQAALVPVFNPTPVFLPTLGANSQRLLYFGDLGGDGLPEIVLATTLADGNPTLENYVYSFTRVGSSVAINALGTFGVALGSGVADAIVPWNSRRFSFSDINGDGLDDFIFASKYNGGATCDSVWAARLNTGGGFGAPVNLTGAIRAGLEMAQTGALCEPVARAWEAQHASMVSYEDLDGDGRTEIIVPRGLRETILTNVRFEKGEGQNNPPGVTQAVSPNPRTENLVGSVQADAPFNLANSRGIRFLASASMNGTPQPLVNTTQLDSGAYTLSRLIFKERGEQSFELVEEALPNELTRQVGADPSIPLTLDLYGDGLVDQVSMRGCRSFWLQDNGTSASACVGTTIENATPTSKAWINDGALRRQGRAPETPELLRSVSDAYGKSIEWRYDALSSSGARAATDLPLYRLPARDGVAPDAPYIDAKHFYFASSMQVVAEMLTRNGIGPIDNPGMNETRYGYEEAMYNQQGRGFQGFRKIISEDHTVDNSDNSVPNAKFGLRSTTIFHQKFPLTGMVECEGTTQLGVAMDSCDAVVETSMTLISGSKNDYLCRVAGAATTATACTDWAARTAATYGFAYPNQTEGFQFDLTNHALMRTTTKNIDIIDQYGNVRAESSSNTSNFAGLSPGGVAANRETRTMSIARQFETDAANWWVNKLIKQTSTAAAVEGFGLRAIDSALNPPRVSTMVYGYDANNRQVNCEAMIPGLYAPAVTASSCDSAAFAPSPLSSATAAQNGLVERRTKSTFDSVYGNVASVSTSARGESLSRSVSSDYTSSGGYFPNTVTDALLAVTTSTFDNRFGKPNSITDPNQLTTTTTFDGMGREIGMVFPMALVADLKDVLKTNHMAPPKLVAYESCAPDTCPTGTVLRVVSDQKGTPRQIAFMDALGRTVRSAKAAFNKTDSSGGVGTWDTVDTQYSTRGLSYQSIEPRQISNRNLATTGLISGGILTTLKYDQLGRPVSKVSTRVARNSAGSYGSGLLYRTEYRHVGFKTSIRVCGLGLSEIACPNGPATNSYGFILDMAREFDESGAVINTTDAKIGVTTFFYDAAHSPVKLVDAELGVTTANYNNVGHRTSVNDPNRGIWTYQYNGFGELKKQIDARALSLTQVFDKLGRMTSRSWMQPDRVSAVLIPLNDTFAYNNDTSGGHYGTLNHTQRSGEGSVREEYIYDALNRPMQKNYVGNSVAGQTWNLKETTRYDPNFGRPVRKNFPAVAGADAQKIYMGYTLGGDPMQTGFDLRYLASDPRSANATRYLRRDEGTNARGQVISSRFGSGDASQAFQWLVSEYDASTGWLLSRCSGLTICSGVAQSGTNIDGAATMKLGYEYDYFGNVSKSVNIGKRPLGISGDVRSETFLYDQLHRMTSAQRMSTGAVPDMVSYDYSPVGNLRFKTDFGSNYNYGLTGPKHGVKTVQLNSGLTQTYTYDFNGNVTSRSRKGVTPETFGYDIDNRPQWTNTTTHTNSSARIDFYLSATGAKALQVAQTALGPRKVIYAGAYEAEYTGPTLSASRTYLAEGVLHNGAGDQQGLSFMHQDRLGSALVITDKGGLILGSDGAQAEFRTFDAFGKARDNKGLDTLDGRLFSTSPNGKRNRKGFTGHEHLDEAGLIHMNGRAYDYNLGRFYGVDPVIQFPTNSQSLNGYSYLMNNPLAGTDPTGYVIWRDRINDCSIGDSCINAPNPFERFGLSAGARSNGASGGQENTQKSQTDGAPGGASDITAAPKYDPANTPTLDAVEVVGTSESFGDVARRHILPMSYANGISGESGSWWDVASGIGTSARMSQRGQIVPYFPAALNHMIADAAYGPLEIPNKQLPTVAFIEFAQAVISAAIPIKALGGGRGAIQEIKVPSAPAITTLEIKQALVKLDSSGLSASGQQSSFSITKIKALVEKMRSGEFKLELMNQPIIRTETGVQLSGHHRTIAGAIADFPLPVKTHPVPWAQGQSWLEVPLKD